MQVGELSHMLPCGLLLNVFFFVSIWPSQQDVIFAAGNVTNSPAKYEDMVQFLPIDKEDLRKTTTLVSLLSIREGDTFVVAVSGTANGYHLS